jgi:hypothetical protein
MKAKFGTTAIDALDPVPRHRAIVADINIFFAKEGFVVIYFAKNGVQTTVSVKNKEELLQFAESYISGGSNGSI